MSQCHLYILSTTASLFMTLFLLLFDLLHSCAFADSLSFRVLSFSFLFVRWFKGVCMVVLFAFHPKGISIVVRYQSVQVLLDGLSIRDVWICGYPILFIGGCLFLHVLSSSYRVFVWLAFRETSKVVHYSSSGPISNSCES